MLRDIEAGVPQVAALGQVIGAADPDVLVLGAMDYDAGGVALAALNGALARPYPHLLALTGNAGIDTGRDMNRDGRLGGPRDMQAYGRFAGQSGIAVLSRLPIVAAEAASLNDLLWRDLPGSLIVDSEGRTGEAARGADVQRLSSGGHWILPLETATGRLTLMLFHATPPVFDGPEDRNGRRNHDEVALWRLLLDGALPLPPPVPPFVLAGTANADPFDGDARREALLALLADPRLTDPRPASPGGAAAATGDQRGDPARDTVDWTEPVPGNLRVDYLLPSADIAVRGSSVLWPGPGEPLAEVAAQASRHRLIWLDIRR